MHQRMREHSVVSQESALEHSVNAMIAEALWGRPKRRRDTDPRKRVVETILAELVGQALPIVGDQDLATRVAYLACRVPTELVKVYLGDSETIQRMAEKAATMAEPPQPPTLEDLIPVAEEAMQVVRRMLAKS